MAFMVELRRSSASPSNAFAQSAQTATTIWARLQAWTSTRASILPIGNMANYEQVQKEYKGIVK